MSYSDNNLQTTYYDPSNDPNNAAGNTIASMPFGIGAGVAQRQANTAAANARQAGARDIGNVALPQFSGQYSLAGLYNPTMYQNPQLAQAAMVNESPEGRAAQLQALQRLGDQSSQAVASQQALDRYNALQNASQFAQGREGAIEQDAARRGQAGSAAQMLARATAAQGASNNMQQAGLQSAQMAALQRLAGTQAMGGLAGQMRGQDLQSAISNQNALNNFGLANQAATNQIRMANTNLQNQAQLGNLGAVQSIMNSNIDRSDRNQMNTYNSAMERATGVSNAMQGLANAVQQGPGLTASADQAGWNTLTQMAGAIGQGAAGRGGGGAPVTNNYYPAQPASVASGNVGVGDSSYGMLGGAGENEIMSTMMDNPEMFA